MDHAGDKQRWKQQCQPPANLSLGLSEEVAEWTDGSELLVLVQHFNSTRFLHERNSQINPGLISWQKVLVIFGHTSLEGVLDDPSFISSDPVPPSSSVCQVCAEGRALLAPCPRDRSQGWTEQAWPQLGQSQALLFVCAGSVSINPSKMVWRWVVLHRRKKRRSLFIKPGFNPSN